MLLAVIFKQKSRVLFGKIKEQNLKANPEPPAGLQSLHPVWKTVLAEGMLE